MASLDGPENVREPASVSQAAAKKVDQWLGSLLEMEGLGQEHWKGIDPDEFVRKLREDWE